MYDKLSVVGGGKMSDCYQKNQVIMRQKIVKRTLLSNEICAKKRCVIFIDQDNQFRLAIPFFRGIEQLSQEQALEKSTYHSGFVEVEINSDIDKDTFLIVYEEETRIIRTMNNLLDDSIQFKNYFMQNLDSADCVYPTSIYKIKKMDLY